MYTIMKERMEEAKERNRRHLKATVQEFSERLDEESEGKPMLATRNNDIFTFREDGTLEREASAS